mgnify:CR=1 FL=1
MLGLDTLGFSNTVLGVTGIAWGVGLGDLDVITVLTALVEGSRKEAEEVGRLMCETLPAVVVGSVLAELERREEDVIL